MKILKVNVTRLSLKLKSPYTIAYNHFDHADHIFIQIDTGRLCGWGCMAPDPFVTGEVVEHIFPEAAAQLPELLKGGDPFRRGKIIEKILKAFPEYPGLWAAVDMALWDLLGKQADLPLWKLLGGYRSRIETSVTIGICSPNETEKQAETFISQGFNILKVKGGNNYEEDAYRLIKLQERWGKNIRLRFDANQGYSREQTLLFLDRIKAVPLEVLEQPTVKEDSHALGAITSQSAVPVMADESLISLMDAFKLAKKGLVDMLNIKLMKTGGISEAIQVNSVARSARIKVMVGCMDESALSISAGLHFALSSRNILYADLDGHLDILEDPASGTVLLNRGSLYPSDLPGLGFSGF